MFEALKLFKDICNAKWFVDTAIILFLNKKGVKSILIPSLTPSVDLFAKKIQTVSLKVCFEDYTGTNSYEDGSRYIEDQFLQQNENPSKLIYVHKTCATDTESITVVFNVDEFTAVIDYFVGSARYHHQQDSAKVWHKLAFQFIF